MRPGRALALAVLLAAPAWAAAEWTTIGSSEKMVVEIDPDLVRTQGPFTMAYTRATFTAPQPIDGNPDLKQHSQLQLHAIDCTAGTSTVVGVMLYAGPYARGELLEQTTRPRTDWSPRSPPPGSLAEATVRLACAERARRAAQ